MNLLTLQDIDIVNKNIKDLQEKSKISQIENIEPKLEERISIINIILNFIKNDTKIIIYGGYATHIYLKESIYDFRINLPDIDIYSSDAVNVLIKLSHILRNKYKNYTIMIKEAFHKDTFSLFVNYTNYLDITYIPEKILSKLKKKFVNNFYLIHPSLIMLDLIRQFNDPLISYWRLDKSFKRFILLNNKYNFLDYLENNNNKTKIDYMDHYYYNLINKNINSSTMIYTGFYCYQLFTYKNFTNIPYLEIISIDYDNDIKKFKNVLKNCKAEQFYPFFQYLNKKMVFYKNNRIILIIYDNNSKCIPYITYNNQNFTTYLYFIQITFSLYLYYNYTKEDVLENYMRKMILNCIVMKYKFFEENKNKNIFDKTIFQQFVIKCKGKTFYTNIEFLKNLESKNKKLNLKRFNYKPIKNNKIKKINYIYQNVSGLSSKFKNL